MGLLNTINSPEDLKKLKVQELSALSEEIRRLIVEVVSETGGHLAPSLGAVDFTLALYYCMNSPKDTIVWDVGHQAYCHKIITGRRDNFRTLRQKGGISGFPNIYESRYDAFTAGHGSTSISTALGLCCARDIAGTDEKIVAVIGDGSLGGGMAYEGLNHAGHLGKDILIILNDNEFSIAPSVGAISRYLNRVITNPIYNRVHDDMQRLLRRVPKLGFRLSGAAKKLEDGLKNLLVPGIIFEEMNIRYFGPVDGHNMSAMVTMFKNVLPLKQPRIIHVVTKKGKGFKPAEDNPEKFHGTAPYEIESGEVSQSNAPTFTSTFSDKITELAAKDKRIVAVTAAMPEGTGLDKFAQKFPDRFFNVGMAEGHAVGFAAGLAKKGLIPVVAIYSTFLQRSYDQIIHDVALNGLHVIFCLDRAGIVGQDGPTHHGAFDISYMRHIPNMVCMAPKDLFEFEEMLKFAVSHNGPVSIRYPRGGVMQKFPQELRDDPVVLGRSETLRSGKDIAIAAIGDMAVPALEAAHMLYNEGIDAEVLNMRFIKPLDIKALSAVSSRINKILVVEDNALQGGFGSAVMEALSASGSAASVRIMGIPDSFMGCGRRDELLADLSLSAEGIARRAKEFAHAAIIVKENKDIWQS